MSASNPLAASLLNGGAGALAGYAASRLVEEHPEAGQRFGASAFNSWKSHLTGRVRELAVAVDLETPELFSAAVQWARESFAAREVPESDLRTGLECLREVLENELPEPANQLATEYLNKGLDVFDVPLQPTVSLDPADPHERLAMAYIEACLSGDTRKATDRVLAAMDDGLEITTIYFDVLAVAQREVGRLWHQGDLGVHEEHVVTATTRSLLPIVASRAGWKATVDKMALGAAVADDQHELGVHMIMDLFAVAGWRSLSLGGRLPVEDLVHAARDFQADLIVLSATLVTHLIPIREAIQAVRKEQPGVKFLVGGAALAVGPQLWRRLGADGYTERAADAVAAGEKLLGLNPGQ